MTVAARVGTSKARDRESPRIATSSRGLLLFTSRLNLLEHGLPALELN